MLKTLDFTICNPDWKVCSARGISPPRIWTLVKQLYSRLEELPRAFCKLSSLVCNGNITDLFIFRFVSEYCLRSTLLYIYLYELYNHTVILVTASTKYNQYIRTTIHADHLSLIHQDNLSPLLFYRKNCSS